MAEEPSHVKQLSLNQVCKKRVHKKRGRTEPWPNKETALFAVLVKLIRRPVIDVPRKLLKRGIRYQIGILDLFSR